jgi:hypothetical protein
VQPKNKLRAGQQRGHLLPLSSSLLPPLNEECDFYLCRDCSARNRVTLNTSNLLRLIPIVVSSANLEIVLTTRRSGAADASIPRTIAKPSTPSETIKGVGWVDRIAHLCHHAEEWTIKPRIENGYLSELVRLLPFLAHKLHNTIRSTSSSVNSSLRRS